MLAEWSVECGEDDPVLVVPWSSPDDSERCAFVDLRENPYDLDRVPEAEQHPALLQALRALNAQRSPVFTAKCDAWAMSADECSTLVIDLDLPAFATQLAGFASYIDLLFRDRTLFVSFHAQEQRMMRLERLLAPLQQPDAKTECVLRPAFVDLPGASPQEGFAISLYVLALAGDAAHAYECWQMTLSAVVGVLRGREFGAP